MKFGVFDHVDRGDVPLAQHFDNRLRLAEFYDHNGFHAYHVAEHHGTPLGMASSPSVFLAAVIQRTHRLRLGPLVYTLPLMNPLRLVEEVCMLDQMSHGRLELGVGRGSSPYELAYFGVTAEESGGLYKEAYEILMQGLQSKTINFEGKHYRFKDYPVVLECVQKPTPPIWYGLSAPAAVPWTAENGVNIVCNGPSSNIRPITDRYREVWAGTARSSARPLPLLGMGRHIVIAETRKDALAAGKRGFDRWYASLQHLWRVHGNPMKHYPIPEDFMAALDAGILLVGTADKVAEGLQREIEIAGVNYVLTRFAFGNLSYEESLRSATIFAQEVMPRFTSEPSYA
ncbi:LLM class flavin-dependent oxidoreductase [Ramlibacter henchirensis]|uniref:LLM class flavin-dependent oxidoreductase n=1 Tax=Ramlibacter henchirensis TaxID=204072 RepID=UPI001430D7A5|nr:LLM class flavin-dependent oxidoreductase [Ramlibacter henchirensis]